MKRTVSLFCFAALFFLLMISSAVADTTAIVTKPAGAKGSTVRMRKKPDGKVLVNVPFGSEVEVLDEQGKWMKISFDGRTGWMMSEFLVLVPSVPETNEPSSSSFDHFSYNYSYIAESENIYSGTLLSENGHCFLHLPEPIHIIYEEYEIETEQTDLWFGEKESLILKSFVGMQLTVSGTLYPVRDDTPYFDLYKIEEAGGSVNAVTQSAALQEWDQLSNEERYWKATALIETLLYQEDTVWSARTLADLDFNDLNKNGFSEKGKPVEISINDNWISDQCLEVYIRPTREGVHIRLLTASSVPEKVWFYGWDGRKQDGNDNEFHAALIDNINEVKALNTDHGTIDNLQLATATVVNNSVQNSSGERTTETKKYWRYSLNSSSYKNKLSDSDVKAIAKRINESINFSGGTKNIYNLQYSNFKIENDSHNRYIVCLHYQYEDARRNYHSGDVIVSFRYIPETDEYEYGWSSFKVPTRFFGEDNIISSIKQDIDFGWGTKPDAVE